MKDRILVPERLKGRIERLVRARMAAAHEDEALARKTVEYGLMQAGVEQLEKRAEVEEV